MSSSSSCDEWNTNSKTPENSRVANIANKNPLPAKSSNGNIQLSTYYRFIEWKNNRKEKSLSEYVFLAYFEELANKCRPPSLWTVYSMLKSIMTTKHGINLENYTHLMAFLRSRSEGFMQMKYKELTQENMVKFLSEAPDEEYLAIKVALIFRINGACTAQDLADITLDHINNENDTMIIKNPNHKRKGPKSFAIHGNFYEIVKKYIDLHSEKIISRRFFQNIRRGHCTKPIGVARFFSMPKEIAKYLNLPDAHSYRSHIFCGTPPGETLKIFERWKSVNLAKGNVQAHTDRQANTNQDDDASDQNEADKLETELLVVKTETPDLDVDPLSDTQEVMDSDELEGMPDEASTSEIKTEVRGRSCYINNDSCPTHTRLLEAILSCVSLQEQNAARAAQAQEAQARANEQILRVQESQMRIQESQMRMQESQMQMQEALLHAQEAQARALERIARLLEKRPQRL